MVESLPSNCTYLFSDSEYGLRYANSAEELFLSEDPSSPTPIEQMIDGLMDDINTKVFKMERELVAELQYTNIEGYIDSDTLLLVEELATKKICGSFLVVHRGSKISNLTEGIM